MSRPVSTITPQERLDTLADDLLTLLESRSTIGKWRTSWMTTIVIEHAESPCGYVPSFWQIMTPLAIRRCEFFAEKAKEDHWDGHIVISGKPSVLRCMMQYVYTGKIDIDRHIHSDKYLAHDSLPKKIDQLLFLSELWVACVKFGVKTGPEAVYTDFKNIIDTMQAPGEFAQLAPVIVKVYSDPKDNSSLLRQALVETCYSIFRTLPLLEALGTLAKVPSFCKDMQEYATLRSSQPTSADTPAAKG